MALDKADVRRIARLARLRLEDRELAPLAAELNQIVGWVEQLGEVETKGVPPMTSVVAMRLALRDDLVNDGGDAEAVLANAPEAARGFFVVPKVVE